MLLFEGKERGGLDPHSPPSISTLSEGNLVDLDLGVLCVLLVLPLIFLHSFCCFGGLLDGGLEHFMCYCHCFGASV